MTRDAVARALDIPLDVDESIVDRIRERFARRGMTMPEINRRQAMVPRGADGAAQSQRHRPRPVARAGVDRRCCCCPARRAR